MDISKDEVATILGISNPLVKEAALMGAATLAGAAAFVGAVGVFPAI
jgi:hypothetical protein